MGYTMAGFDVTGVDIQPQPRYPYRYRMLDTLTLFNDDQFLRTFDAIHASPPCQAYSSATANRASHPDLYAKVRDLLESTDVPWVIENVIGAPYRSGIVLCGTMFGVPIRRHRNFESSILMPQQPCQHKDFDRPWTITGHAGGRPNADSKKPTSVDGPRILGCGWMTWDEAVLAIPPRTLTGWVNSSLRSFPQMGGLQELSTEAHRPRPP